MTQLVVEHFLDNYYAQMDKSFKTVVIKILDVHCEDRTAKCEPLLFLVFSAIMNHQLVSFLSVVMQLPGFANFTCMESQRVNLLFVHPGYINTQYLYLVYDRKLQQYRDIPPKHTALTSAGSAG